MNNLWYLYLILIPVGIVLVFSPVWRIVKFFETVFHEFGHAFVGIILGQKLHGFKLRFDTSGETATLTSGYGLRSVATQLAGYPAPVILGSLTLYYSYMGASVSLAWFYVGVSVFMAFFIRNLFGFIPIIIVGGLAGLSIFLEEHTVPSTFIFVTVVGAMLIISGLKSFLDLFKYLPEGSDVWMLRDRTYLGQRFWVIIMFIMTLVFIPLNILVITWITSSINTIYSSLN